MPSRRSRGAPAMQKSPESSQGIKRTGAEGARTHLSRCLAVGFAILIGMGFSRCDNGEKDRSVESMTRCLRAQHISVNRASYWRTQLGVRIPRDLIDFYLAALPENEVIVGVFRTERSARSVQAAIRSQVKQAFEGRFVAAIGRKYRTVLIWFDLPSVAARERVERCIMAS